MKEYGDRSSVIASVAPTLGVLVAARAVQAVGAAMIAPTSLGLGGAGNGRVDRGGRWSGLR